MTISCPTIANLKGRSDKLWLDSGATHHVISDAAMLRDTHSPSVTTVILGGGEEHPVVCEGHLLLKGGPRGSVLLTSVLCVPTLEINLLSTPQLTSKKGSCWEGEHFCKVMDSKGRVILRGHKLDGMYRLDCQLPASSSAHVNAVATSEVWHKRFGHISHKVLQTMVRNKAVEGLGQPTVGEPAPCDVCDMSKQTRSRFPRSDSRATAPLELVHSDTMGPLPVLGLEDEAYVVTALDDFSGYAETILVRAKSSAATALVDLLVRWQRQLGRTISTLRTDQGTEFKGALAEYCTRKGIVRQVSAAYSPEQNGRAERLNRTLTEKVRALLLEHNLPKAVWSEAMRTAAHIRNRTTGLDPKRTPYELFFNKKPSVSHLRIYGCKAFVYIEKAARDKLDAVSEEVALIGYADNSKAYRLLKPGVNGQLTVIEAISVRFHEQSAPTFLSGQSERCDYTDITQPFFPRAADPEYQVPVNSDSGGDSSDDSDYAPNPAPPQHNNAAAAPPAPPEVPPCAELSAQSDSATHESEGSGVEANPPPGPFVPVVPDVEVAAAEQQRRYPKRSRRPPTEWYRETAARLCQLAVLDDNPATYRQAMARQDKDFWLEAVDVEVAALKALQVFSEVDPPPGVRPLPSKLVFGIKRDLEGNIDKYKVRLVAKGFRQVAGRDYDDVYAPTAQHVTLRVLLAIASALGYVVEQLDVRTAFLNGELESPVYIRLPPELGGKVWQLHKALYGLKQAAREWYAKLRTEMRKHGFTPSKHEPCLFFRGSAATRVYVMVHVDDALVIGAQKPVSDAKNAISQMFDIKDLGKAKHFLGMNIQRNQDGGYTLSQPKFIKDMLERFRMSEATPKPTPLSVGLKLSKHDGEELPEGNQYQALVGCLLYASVNTRPDIAHACGILSRFMSCPKQPHWEAAKHVLRYLKGTADLGLTFSGTKAAPNEGVYACDLYSDADFAADVDRRKSTTGAVLLMQGAAVLWLSKLQSLVATSTAEAEYIAAAVATTEGLWVRKLLGEISGRVSPVNLAVDNQSAIVLITEHTAGQSGRTKHVDVKFHFVRDRYQCGDVSIRFVPTIEQRADMFTKQLGGCEFKRHRKTVMGM